MRKFSNFIVVLFAVLILAGTASALPIAGDIGIIGYGIEAIDTLTATAIPAPAFAMVSVPTGDFDAFLDPGNPVNYYGFTFNPAPTPVADPLWTAGGFSFALDSIIVSYRDETKSFLMALAQLPGTVLTPL